MRIPRAVIEQAANKEHSRSGWVEYLKYKNNQFQAEYYYYSRARKLNGLKIMLGIVIKENGCNLFSSNVYFTNMSGYRMVLDNIRTSYYQPEYDENNKMINVNYEPKSISAYIAYDIKEFHKCEDFKYLSMEGAINCGNVIRFIRKCRKYAPQIEILQKAGFGGLVSDSRFMRMKKDKQKVFYQFVKGNESYIKEKQKSIYGGRGFIYNQFVKCLKNKIDLKTCQQLDKIPKSYVDKIGIEKAIQLSKYLKQQSCDYYEYDDYISGLNKLKVKSIDPFPKSLKKAHDKILEKIKIKENKGLNKSLKKVSSKFNLKLKDYEIIVPSSVSKFVEIGREMSNCVGKLDYDIKMSENKDLIFALKQNGQYCVCCEYDFVTEEMIQCYGKNNSTVSQEIKDHINKVVIKQIRKLAIQQ